MTELGYAASAATVVEFYDDAINGFVYDERDMGLEVGLSHAVTFDTMMRSDTDRAVLAQKVLDWIKEWVGYEHMGNYPG